VSRLSKPQGHLRGQPDTNPRGHVNALSTVDKGFEESPVMVLQKVASVSDSAGTGGGKKEESLGSTEKPSHWTPVRPYQPLVPFP